MKLVYEYCAECGKKLPLNDKNEVSIEKCPGCNVKIKWLSTLDGLSCYKERRQSNYENLLDSYIENTLEQALDKIKYKAECDENGAIELENEITELEGKLSVISSKISVLSANEELFEKEIADLKKKSTSIESLIEIRKDEKAINIRRSTHLRKQLKKISISFGDK